MLVATGGTDGRAPFCAEEPVQRSHDDNGEKAHTQHRMRIPGLHTGSHGLYKAGGHQHIIVAGGQRQVRLDGLARGDTHNGQVNRPQTQLGQNTGQNCGDLALGVQDAGDSTGQRTDDKCYRHRDPGSEAQMHHNGTDRTAGTEGAIHCQVGKLQYFIGTVQTDSHNAPDQTLRGGTGHCIDKRN